jgi:hypothetical protein
MPQRGRGLGLALGAHRRLALARDHLQRDVEAALLVARKPDVTHASGAKRPQRSVPSKDELLREGSRRHPPLLLRAQEKSFPRRRIVEVRPRQMSQHDDDIQFDFFEDEPATSETAQTSRVRIRRGGSNGNGTPKSFGPPRGPGPLLRLLGVVAVVIGVVLLFGVLINSCASSSRKDSYADYMQDVQQIATQSTANGTQLAKALTTPGASAQKIEQKIRGIAAQEQQNVNRAQGLDAPGRLRPANGHLGDALTLRVSGLAGLAAAFKSTAGSKSDDEEALDRDSALLAAQASRLVASDIVWDDLFHALALQQLQADNVEGVTVPESHIVTNSELVSAAGMKLVLQRIRADTSGDNVPHGTNIESVKAQPGDQTLTPGQLNTVTATTELSFDVTVLDSGQAQEVGIDVTLTLNQGTGKPIVKTEQIPIINPGESVTVTFDGLGDVQFARRTTVNVDVEAVPGELTKTNNSAEYQVIFTLP